MSLGFPKPPLRVLDRVAYKRQHDQMAGAFRAAVWKRDQGICQACGRKVVRTIELVPNRGEVHHRRTRAAHPDLRYDVSNGVLLCVEDHRRAQRGEIHP